ncbi:PKD domain-containing protein [Fulvivirgaceae bacterium BMA10]|uniref:PKD domain-containing protein n=1 Tax=Splendidivirga corallicola TaxID=3051826 RepID=A0ABT8KNQ4_9BACT|nr:PKD domain-containing protein [Fulvivirgaceae bacterium BMA10]
MYLFITSKRKAVVRHLSFVIIYLLFSSVLPENLLSQCLIPDLGAETVGRKESCDPLNFGYVIRRYKDNDPSTTYKISFGDGEEVTMTQSELNTVGTDTIYHDYTEVSCENPEAPDGKYTFRIVARNNCNADSAVIEISPIKIGKPPLPDFDFPNPACVNFATEFQNLTEDGFDFQCSTDAIFLWDFGDGSEVVEREDKASVLHTYNRIGNFTVKLTVVHDCGSETVEKKVEVTGPPNPIFEIGNPGNISTINSCVPLSFVPLDVCVPTTVPVRSISTGAGLTESWSISPSTGAVFSNGTTSSDNLEDVITFSVADTFRITLTTESNCGRVMSCVKVIVRDEPIPENISIDGIPDNLCSPADIDLSVDIPDAISYQWSIIGLNVADPTPPVDDDTANPGPFTLTTGDYEISLTVANSCGSVLIKDTISVIEPFEAQIQEPQATICEGKSITLNSHEVDGASYQWLLDDQDIEGATEPSFEVNIPGNYSVRMSVDKCSVTSENTTVFLQEAPEASITTEDRITFCEDETISTDLHANSGDGLTYQWFKNDSIIEGATNVTFTATELGLYSVEVFESGCSKLSNTIKVAVSPPPELSLNIPTPSICLNDSIELCVSGAKEYIWSPTTGLSTTSGSCVFASPQETTTYTITGIDSLNCEGSISFTLEVFDLPNVSVSASQSEVCPGESVTLSAAGASEYSWLPVESLNVSEGFEVIATPVNTTTYSAIGLNSNGCRDTSEIVIVVKEAPAVIAGPDSTVCITSAPLELFNLPDLTPSTGGVWSGPGVDEDTGVFHPSLAGLGSHDITYRFVDSDTECPNEDQLTISVFQTPSPAFSGPQLACSDAVITFSNETPNIPGGTLSFEWDPGDGSPIQISRDIDHVYRQPGIYTIVLYAMGQPGQCLSSISKTIEIVAPPVALFSKTQLPATLCGPSEVNFTNQSTGDNLTYDWDFGNGESSNLANPHSIVFDPGILGDTSYIVSLKISSPVSSCSESRFIDTVTVKPLPISKFIFGFDEICADYPLQLNNFSLGSSETFTWDFGDGSPLFTTSDTGTISHAFPYEGREDTTYMVTLIAANNCGSDSLTKPIRVKSKTVDAFFGVDTNTGCAPLNVKFKSNQSGLNSLTWIWGDVSHSNSVGGTEREHLYEKPGTFVAQLVVQNGCNIDTFSQQITVLALPEVSFEGPGALCLGQEARFMNTSPDPTGSIWDFGTGAPLFQGSIPPPHMYKSPGVYNVSLTIVDPLNGCENTVSQNIEIFEQPIASFDIPENVCQGETFSIQNLSTHSDTFFWQFKTGQGFIAGNEPEPPVYTVTGLHEITLIAQNSIGCSDSSSMLINVLRQAEPDFQIQYNKANNKSPLRVDFVNTTIFPSKNDGFFEWDLGKGEMFHGFEPPPQRLYINNGDTIQLFNVMLSATTSFGCSSSIEKQVVIHPSDCDQRIKLPNIFTPNGDNLNDVLRPLIQNGEEVYKPITIDDEVKNYKMQIYSRWGELIFETTDVEDGWTGVGHTEDVYMCVITFQCKGLKSGSLKSQEVLLKY